MTQLKQEVVDSVTVAASLQRAVDIGTELLAIESAIDQAKIGWMSTHPNSHGYNFYDQPVFIALSKLRDGLRKELNALDFPGVR